MTHGLWLIPLLLLSGGDDATFLDALSIPEIARGEDEATLEAWKEILERSPGSPGAEMILRMLLRDAGRYPNYRSLRPTLEAMRKGGRCDGITAALAASHLARIYSQEGARAEADRMARELSLVRTVIFAGPFGQRRHSLHDRVFPPEGTIVEPAPSIDETYSSQGESISWRLLGPVPGTGPLDFGPYLRRPSGVVYVVAQVRVKNPTPAALRISTRSSIRVWLNGRQVADSDRGRSWLPYETRVGIALSPGWNRIGIKIASRSRAGILLRITDPDGAPIDGLEVADGRILHSLPEGGEGVGVVEPAIGAEAYYSDLLKEDPDSVEAHLGLGFLLWAQGVLPDAVDHLSRGVELAPGSPHLRVLFARLLKSATHLPSTVRKNRARTEYDRARKIDPSFTPACIGLARILTDDGKADEAIALLRRLLEVHPDAQSARYQMHQIALAEDWITEAEAAASQLEEARPGWAPVLEFRARQFRKKGNRKAAAEIHRELYQANRGRRGSALAVASYEEATGRYETAIRIYEELLSSDPVNTSTLWSLSRAQLRSQLFDLALETTRRIAQIQPWSGSPWRMAGQIERRRGDEEEAIRHYRKALEVDPGLHRLRRLLHHFDGESDQFEIPYDPDLRKLIESAPGREVYPKSKVLSVLDLTVLKIYEDGSATEVGHVATKVLTEEGKEQVKTHYPRGEILEIRTITPDGEILEPIRTSTGREFHLPGLEPGAVVEAKWRRDLARPRSGFDWGPFYFQDPSYEEPYLLSRLVVIVPRGFDVRKLEKHLPFEPRIIEEGDGQVLLYEAREMGRVEPELWMPAPDEHLPSVRFYQSGDWADVNDQYRESVLGRTRLTSALRDAAREAVEGVERGLEQARALYEYVNETIKRSGPAGEAHQVLLEKAGDRSILYMALLEATGVPFDYVRARPSRPFVPEPDWERPSSSHFFAPLLRIRPDGSPPIWLSMGSRFYPFGFIPDQYLGGEAFITSPAGGAITLVPGGEGPDQKDTEIVEIWLEEGGGMRCVVDSTRGAASLYSLKERLEEMPEDDLERILQDIVNARFPEPTMTLGELPEISVRGTPFRFRIEAKCPQYVEEQGDQKIIQSGIDPMKLAAAFLGRVDRTHPIVIRQTVRKQDDVTIHLGPYRVTSLPSGRVLKSLFGAYSITYTQPDEGTVRIERKVHLLPTNLPATAYPSLVRFCREVDEADDRPIGVEPRP
ncbi:MAG: tetratricopeptide repeat protein [Planctomycetota bacterium]|nr:tetratricopeptide repeat protein [Planctomycetota bacterium]